VIAFHFFSAKVRRALPAEFKISDEKLQAQIRGIISDNWDKHYAVVNIDRNYI
jgi:hypothetical protein